MGEAYWYLYRKDHYVLCCKGIRVTVCNIWNTMIILESIIVAFPITRKFKFCYILPFLECSKQLSSSCGFLFLLLLIKYFKLILWAWKQHERKHSHKERNFIFTASYNSVRFIFMLEYEHPEFGWLTQSVDYRACDTGFWTFEDIKSICYPVTAPPPMGSFLLQCSSHSLDFLYLVCSIAVDLGEAYT